MHDLPAAPLALALLAASALAQTPAHLVGLTAQIPTLTHRNHAACATMAQCSPVGFPQTLGLPYLGGTGWDPILSGAWISNGPALACIDDTCNYLCPIGPSPTPSPITGLEVVESLNQIWATDVQGNICKITRSCPPALINFCNTGLAPTPTLGLSGLAVDEGNQFVFYSQGNFATGVTTIFVATMANPCAPFFVTPLPPMCTTLRTVTGLAVDWGNTTLYLTDGFTSVAWNYTPLPGPAIAFGAFNCCFSTNGGDTFVGLAWRPAPAVPFGGPCASAPCPACPMVHALNGDPNLGNAAFALTLNGAPAGSLAWCQLTVGACSAPGTSIAALCGPLWTTTAVLGTLGPNVIPGVGCGGATQYPVPLPPVPAFAGFPIASQCIAVCPGFGISMSNCLSWVLQGN